MVGKQRLRREAPVNACPVGGDAAAKQIAKIMGEEITESVRQVAVVKCTGDCSKTHLDYKYAVWKTVR